MSRNPKKKKKNITVIAIIVSLIILAIPTTFILVTGVKSLMARGNPVIGNRFSNDQNPKIKDKDIKAVESAVKELPGVESLNVNLAAATLRVYVLDSSLTADNLSEKESAIYDGVTSILSVEDYFTQDGIKKQYDLEIHIFNQATVTEASKPSYVYGVYLKNAGMEKPKSQILSTPISQDMVDFFIEEEAYNNQPPVEAEDEYDDYIGEGEGDE